MATVQIFPDAQFLARAAADQVIQIANEAVRERGLFSIVLSGGGTPQMLYQLLTTEPFSESIDWSKMHVFWGDERNVPPDSPDSNYGRAKAVMLDALPILPENIHRVHTEFTPEQAAAAYEETLLAFFSSLPSLRERGQAGFDLVLLGMGEDGHTASLFPGTPAVEEKTRWVMAQYVDKLAAWRITLTPALLNRAKNVIFLVSGAGKSQVLQKVVYGSYQPERYPAQVIRPDGGELLWLVDEEAAAQF